jgi:small subunit ribosomal protein S1
MTTHKASGRLLGTTIVVDGSNGLLLEIDGQIVPNYYDATFREIEEGEVVTGHVVRIDKDEVLVDIGYKSEGVIPANELSIRKSVDPNEEVHLGEEVDVIVMTKEDQDGRLIMSKKRARFETAWRRIEAAAEAGEPVEGTVIEVVKGGLLIDLGVRGFLPASLVDIRRVPNLDEYMGTKIETKVIELNRSRNIVVLSRRAVLEEERKEVRQQILDRLQPGLVVEGQISNIVDFGAFVDLNGIDGLIHVHELSWSHVNHPSEILNIGDTVKVKVLDIDRDRQRISLGLKQTQEDPWQRIVDTYNVGDEVAGKVTEVVTFGAFVEILDGVEGLVHISELAAHHVESPREIVHPGDEIRVKILEIDSERRRLLLSAKRVEDQILPVSRSGGEVAELVGDEDETTVETVAPADAAAGGVSKLDAVELARLKAHSASSDQRASFDAETYETDRDGKKLIDLEVMISEALSDLYADLEAVAGESDVAVIDREKAMSWVEIARRLSVRVSDDLPAHLDADAAAEVRRIIINILDELARADLDAPLDVLDRFFTQSEAIRQILRDARELRADFSESDARALVAYLQHALPRVTQADQARLAGMSTRHLQRLGKGKGTPPYQLVLAARLVKLLRPIWNPQGVVAWFYRERSELDGHAPIDLASDPGFERMLLGLARQGRAQHGA